MVARIGRPGEAVKGLLWVNGIFFLLSLLLNPAETKWTLNPFAALAPDTRSLLMLGATGTWPVLKHGDWFTLVTAGFLHGGLLHLLFNMTALYHVGQLAERVFGPFRMLLIYLVSSVAGFALSLAGGVTLTVGASAAICGLIGALLYYAKRRGGLHGRIMYKHTQGWVIGLVVIGFIMPGINNWGHGGGLVAGIVAAALLGYSEIRREKDRLRLFVGILALAVLALLIWVAITALIFRGSLGRLI
jgi:rhomboid protease GluP